MEQKWVTEVNGSLFDLKDESTVLAHCVSSDLAMGKGIALSFRNKWGRPEKKKVSSCLYVQEVGKNLTIYHLVTKARYWQKPSYKSVGEALDQLAKHYKSAKSTVAVHMPRIGCGLDDLNWDKMKGLLREWAAKNEIRVVVHTLSAL